MITYLIFPYSAKFQKSGTFINSHSHIRNQCWTLNRTSTGHSTHQGVTPLNLANLFHSEVCRHTSKMNNKRCLLTQQKYHLRGATLQNMHKVGIQVYPPFLPPPPPAPHPYEFVEKLKKRFCMLSMFTIINKVTWNLLNLVSVISSETHPIT